MNRRPSHPLAMLAARIVSASAACVFALPRHRAPDNTPLLAARSRLPQELERMRDSPVTLARPVLILNGYRGWSGLALNVCDSLRALTGEHERVQSVSYPTAHSIDAALRIATSALNRHFPQQSIDIVGVSMGGLVARVLAGQTGAVARIFTLATPHRGSRLAERFALDEAGKAMRPGSAFLTALDNSAMPETVCYTMTHDGWVGAARAFPRSHAGVYWDRGPVWMSHFAGGRHPLFLADIALRLRGESPLLTPDCCTMPPCD